MGEIFHVKFGRKFQDEHENVRHLTTANWIMAQADFERPHAGCDEMMDERRKGKGCDCWRFYANEMTGLMGEEHNKRGKTAFPQIFQKTDSTARGKGNEDSLSRVFLKYLFYL